MKEQISKILTKNGNPVACFLDDGVSVIINSEKVATELETLFNREHEILMDKNKVLMEMVDRQWIPVSERLPEDRGRYLCWDVVGSNSKVCGWMGNNFLYQYEVITHNITHWQPLPTPPISTPSQNKI